MRRMTTSILKPARIQKKRWGAMQAALHEHRIYILQSKGFTEGDADPAFVKIVDACNQSVATMNAFFNFITSTGGPISAKGRTRRAVEGWSRAADRVSKFASMIGLEKRALPRLKTGRSKPRCDRSRAAHSEVVQDEVGFDLDGCG
jgi:hypothetical protein